MNPQISIIIPTYNAAKTLERCLQSIICQDYLHFEVWLIDAVSTDDTLQIIKKYASKRPIFKHVSEPDNGIYDAMNKGIKICSGNWLYFLGSDDTVHANNVLSIIAREINTSNTKIIYGNVIMRGKNQWNLDNVVFNGEYDLEKVVNVNICHQAIFYHKSIFQQYGFYNLKYITGADYDFNIRCYASTEFSYIDLIIANFYVGGHSTHVEDNQISKDRGALLFKYFGSRIYHRSFINSRLYLQQAALYRSSGLNLWERLFCLAAYVKLKIQSIF